jgi:hypothetical protein
MGLTPKRVERVLDAWDEATKSGRATAFTGNLLVMLILTVGAALGRSWGFFAVALILDAVFFRMLWELADSWLRRLLRAQQSPPA